ncbi:AAA domain-containing protein [Candidatus Venteria ishoeyi]|uniref:AAA domain-containing protein n=1 Tax=Candidatus Venteria ishoeyi TaxID=1899563 RepID=UPI0025A676C5|nr:AAA domain-containing protein [Candidatus Venteria ishoeyi]MDM8546988.1 AAA domain-containing protein [Candidatus Venteria ishoeyi]
MKLDKLQQRLNAASFYSPLLRLRLGGKPGQARLLDCQQFEAQQTGLGQALLDTIISGKGRWQWNCPDQKLYAQINHRIYRQAELAQRETGVHALWLGYPLFSVADVAAPGSKSASPKKQALLAPIFLFPVQLQTSLQHQGRLTLQRPATLGNARLNPLLAHRLRHLLGIDFPELPLNPDAEAIAQFLTDFCQRFHDAPRFDAEADLCPIPALDNLPEQVQLHPAAVLGYFHTPNAALLSDLEVLEKQIHETQAQNQDLPLLRLLTDKPKALATPNQQKISEADSWLVYPADFSQTEAVAKARQAPGLVIHGPPGTGKSQTIVNIIADALARRETVLMICQKQAALQVVRERLQQAGLADLCMQVQDADSERLNVFRSLRAQIDSLPDTLTELDIRPRLQLAQQITRLESQLEKHTCAVQQRQENSGLSYREILAEIAALETTFPGIRPLQGLQTRLAQVNNHELEVLSEQLLKLGHLFGQATPLENPWHLRKALRKAIPESEVRAQLQRLRTLNARHLHLQEDGLPVVLLPENPQALGEKNTKDNNLDYFAGFLEKLRNTSLRILKNPQASKEQAHNPTLQAWWSALRGATPLLLLQHQQRCANTASLLEQLDQHPIDSDLLNSANPLAKYIPSADMAKCLQHTRYFLSYQAKRWRFILPRWYTATRTLQKLHQQAENGDSLLQAVQNLHRYLENLSLHAELVCLCQTLVPGRGCTLRNPLAQQAFLRATLIAFEQAQWLYQQEQQQQWLQPLFDQLEKQSQGDTQADFEQTLEQATRRLPMAKTLLNALDDLQHWLQPQALQLPQQQVRAGESLEPWLDSLEQGFAQMPALQSLEKDRKRHGGLLRALLETLEDYEQQRRQNPDNKKQALPQPPENLNGATGRAFYGRWWDALLRRSMLQVWRLQCEQDNPSLRDLTPEAHADLVQRLQDALHEKQRQESPLMLQQWQKRQLPLRNRPWKRLFQLRSSRQNQAKRLREAVHEGLAEGLLDLRPCWLSNPDTAAQIFPLQAGLFDLVIFDEASQCPLEQAVPVLYRGKRLVVCGDEKQLPPTGFFNSRQDANQDNGDDDEITQSWQEDLLQTSIGILPETRLRVHYRSQNPALIQFSNRAFYHDLLEIPPAAHQASNRIPIEYQFIDGIYQQRCNEQEAEAVLNQLQVLWQQAHYSVGVVTFNQVQRDLIEDKLAQRCQNNRDFAKHYQQQLKAADNQSLFIKNLENVQGDERDALIFSTTFGPDASGRVQRRFGPLGSAGGERRLNVAITRAKTHITVISSLPPESLPELRNYALSGELKPAHYLSLYLHYAQGVAQQETEQTTHLLSLLGQQQTSLAAQASGGEAQKLLADVQQKLEQHGYVCEQHVGSGGLQIDLAVKNAAGDYKLGLLCDGGNWFNHRSNRMQTVWRQQLLQARGWRLYVLWSQRWWLAQDAELKKILACLS